MSTETDTLPRASPEVASADSKKSKKRKNDPEEIEVDLSLPEPPSKKAKRLLKKGKTLPVKKDSDDEASDKEEGGDRKDKDKKKERSPFGVWIGNLRFSVTKHDLRDWLLGNSGGSITAEHITRIKLPSSKPKGARRSEGGAGGAEEPFENKGYAYVDFSSYDATIAAIALSETEWHRRKLLIKDAKSFEGRPAKPKADGVDAGAGAAAAEKANAEPPKPTAKKIFVGNLSFQTTEDDLHELFGTCGEIEWVKVAQFEDSGKCKGYAWVKFKEAEAAEWAVKGFVKIKEVEETEEDFMDVNDKEEEQQGQEKDAEQQSEDDDDADKEKQKNKEAAQKANSQKEERRVKTRKWWVNTLHGRRLKIEAAEDDQTRYKKRYGGKGAAAAGAQKEKPARRETGGDKQRTQASNHRHNNKRRQDHVEGKEKDAENSTVVPKEAEVSNFRQDISVARLTGAPVKPQGKKTTFD
ncbi:RNA-binding protein [Diaporthe helianthi]|uniref:RNA-binding protein n=1 Tax=Diaporthe helianthi TaxID=158607 RepID=A0A2P5HVY5_DIAHE|nr:RNA-binding protein [Diaporthe helianthi]